MFLAKKIPDKSCRTRNIIAHRFFPAVKIIAEHYNASHPAVPAAIWLSARNLPVSLSAPLSHVLFSPSSPRIGSARRVQSISELTTLLALETKFEPVKTTIDLIEWVSPLALDAANRTLGGSTLTSHDGNEALEVTTCAEMRRHARIDMSPLGKVEVVFLMKESDKPEDRGQIVTRILDLFVGLRDTRAEEISKRK